MVDPHRLPIRLEAELAAGMEEMESRYLELTVNPEKAAAARTLKPMTERQVFGRSVLLFDGVPREQLSALGEVRTPSIEELFVAVLGNQPGLTQGAVQ